jgi:hypothetical protein
LSRTYLEKPYNKKLAGGVAQGEGPSTKKKKKKAIRELLTKPCHFTNAKTEASRDGGPFLPPANTSIGE